MFQSIIISLCVWMISAYENLKFYIAYFLTEKVKKRFLKHLDKTGFKLVHGHPRDINELGIIRNEQKFYQALLSNPTYALAEFYAKGDIECHNFNEFIYESGRRNYLRVPDMTTWLVKNFDMQSGQFAWDVAQHYDMDVKTWKMLLDTNLQYSCGYWKNAKSLEEAQINKLELTAKKLKLKPNMTVLDLGCGWGALAKYLAKEYNVKVEGCTISTEQKNYADSICKNLPVKIILRDYQTLLEHCDQKYDRIVSIEFMEHVGPKNYEKMFKIVNKLLKNDGIFVLQTSGRMNPSYPGTIKWSHQYIFPNGWLPVLKDLILQAENLFVIEDVHNYGANMELTIKAWENNLEKAKVQIVQKFGMKFFRIWKIYFQTAQGSYKSRNLHVFQVVYSKNGIVGGYDAPR